MYKRLIVSMLLLLSLVGCSLNTGNTLPDSTETETEIVSEVVSTETEVYEPVLSLDLTTEEIATLTRCSQLENVGHVTFECPYPSFSIKSRSESDLLNIALESDIAINSFAHYIEETYGEFTVTDCWNVSRWCPVLEGVADGKDVKYIFICDSDWLVDNADVTYNFEVTGDVYIGY